MLRGLDFSRFRSHRCQTLSHLPRRSRAPGYQLSRQPVGAAAAQVFLTGTQALVRLHADAAPARCGRGPGHARLHQRLPRLAARHGRPGGVEGGQEVRARQASSSCRRSTRSSAPRPCWARSASRPIPSAPARACSRMWYGKGPGVDRAGDALKHGNAYGASPHGGVLMVAGDDHGCVSSSMPHQSDQAFQSWHAPIVAPGQRRRVPRVRPLRLGAVALLGQLGGLHGAVRSGGERRRRSTSTW